MSVDLLESVGFEWVGHPHRLHTMRIDPALEGGIEVVGGPWTTGDRARDTLRSLTSWRSVDEVEAEEIDLPVISADGPGVAEARWPLEGTRPAAAVAVTGLSVTSESHPAGFQVAGFGVGVDIVDGCQVAWLRTEAGRVPERRERFEQIAVEASVRVAVLQPATRGSVTVRRLRDSVRTRAGFRPHHPSTQLDGVGAPVLGLAGWSWSIVNTPKRRGRALRSFGVATTPEGAAMTVSNSGEVTRVSDLAIAADVVIGTPGRG